MILGSTTSPSLESGKNMMDVNMLVSNEPGARERTFEDYGGLFLAAGFEKQASLIPLLDIMSLVQVIV